MSPAALRAIADLADEHGLPAVPIKSLMPGEFEVMVGFTQYVVTDTARVFRVDFDERRDITLVPLPVAA